MALSADLKAIVGFTCSALLPLGMAAMAYRYGRLAAETNASVVHARKTIESAERAYSNYQDSLLQARRYALGGGPAAADALAAAKTRTEEELSTLRRSAAEDQIEGGDGAEPLILEIRRGLAAPASAPGDVAAAARKQADILESDAQRTIDRRRARQAADFRGALSLTVAVCGLALASFAISVLILRRDLRRRIEAEAVLRRHGEELARSNEELARFAYLASHDLKEPLRTVVNYTEKIAQRCEGGLDADGRRYVRQTIDAALRMRDLIDGLLDYSRAGGEASIERADAGKALDAAVDNLRAAFDEAGAVVERGPMPDAVIASPFELSRVFQNLLANALKFRGTQAPKTVVTAERRGGDWVFCVRDNGIGIDMMKAEGLFVLFKRLHPAHRYPGTGLGLAICKKIVEGRGGRIWVESEPGAGSAFFFTAKAAS